MIPAYLFGIDNFQFFNLYHGKVAKPKNTHVVYGKTRPSWEFPITRSSNQSNRRRLAAFQVCVCVCLSVCLSVWPEWIHEYVQYAVTYCNQQPHWYPIFVHLLLARSLTTSHPVSPLSFLRNFLVQLRFSQELLWEHPQVAERSPSCSCCAGWNLARPVWNPTAGFLCVCTRSPGANWNKPSESRMNSHLRVLPQDDMIIYDIVSVCPHIH
jgi:hypothetical protein